jgi:transcriptional regulator with XRE-family HTH domain
MLEVTSLELGKKVRIARKRKNWRQKDLAAAVGVPASQVSRIECGYIKALRTSSLKKLAIALEVSADFLLDLQNDLPKEIEIKICVCGKETFLENGICHDCRWLLKLLAERLVDGN